MEVICLSCSNPSFRHVKTLVCHEYTNPYSGPWRVKETNVFILSFQTPNSQQKRTTKQSKWFTLVIDSFAVNKKTSFNITLWGTSLPNRDIDVGRKNFICLAVESVFNNSLLFENRGCVSRKLLHLLTLFRQIGSFDVDIPFDLMQEKLRFKI